MYICTYGGNVYIEFVNFPITKRLYFNYVRNGMYKLRYKLRTYRTVTTSKTSVAVLNRYICIDV